MENSIKIFLSGLAICKTNLKTTFVVLFLFFFAQISFGQEYVSTTVASPSEFGLTPAGVDNPSGAAGIPDEGFATLSASGIVVKAVVNLTYSSSASLTLNFPSSIAARKKAYIRISDPTSEGVSLDLSSLVGVLGLFTNNTITVTTNGGGTAQYDLVRDPSGNLFIAVSSSASFTNAKVTLNFANSVNGLVGFDIGSISLKVHHAVTYENTTTFTPCEAVQFVFAGVDPHSSGVDLALTLALQNPVRSVDGIVSATNYALLQNGTVAVASTVSQDIYLGKTVPGTNEVRAVVSQPEGVILDLDVLSNITFQAFAGNTAIGTPKTLESALIDLSLLTSFSAGNLVNISFVPGTAYDRIVIKSNTLANANLFTGLRIHEIGSRPPIIFTGGLVTTVTAGSTVSKTITTATSTTTPVTLPGFSVGCGTPSSFTYALSNVTPVGGRIAAGSLPSTLSLTPAGVLQGPTTTAQQGTYTFDVEATSNLGQKKVAQFVLTLEAPLPVTLISFTAKKEGQTATLSWSTSSETNSDRFEVERSQNRKTWLKVGDVLSNGESLSVKPYSFVDKNPINGENLYRLKMIDNDGSFAYSRIESLSFTVDQSVSLYPNPVANSQQLKIEVADWNTVKMVKVFDSRGKVIFESSNSLETGIKTDYLSSGLYIVQVIQKDGKADTRKFIKL